MTQSERKIFVVDDENVIASTLAIILNQSGFEAVAFTDPLEALETARLSSPDLLLSDVMMPQMTGLDLAIELRKFAPGCKVLLFSGQASTADLLEKAQRDGHDFALLTKPVHPTDLLSALRDL